MNYYKIKFYLITLFVNNNKLQNNKKISDSNIKIF